MTLTLDKTQIEAVARATSSARLSLISGGAGTGKTTIIDAVCKTLEDDGKTPTLCAFAGKAAARMREATKRPASTIHRMLGFDGKRFVTQSLAGQDIIIDEASMVDSALLAEVVRRGPRRLVLVGDQAQLPPVGRGQPYHDLLSLRPELSTNLTRCYRNKEAVFQAAAMIRAGQCPPDQITSDGELWRVINTGDAAQTQATILPWVLDAEKWDFSKDLILIARNGDSDAEPATVAGLNAAIANSLNADRGDKKNKLCIGDRVICGKNLPALDCWNGTTGTVSGIDADGGIWVKTDSPVIDMARTHPGASLKSTIYTDRVLFTRENRSHLSWAWALTCHKAQGSQARRVLVIALMRDTHGLLDRSWIYTAVTRARETAVVVGQVSALRVGIESAKAKQTVMQQLGNQKEDE